MINQHPHSTDTLRLVIHRCLYEASIDKFSWDGDTITFSYNGLFDLIAKGVHNPQIRLTGVSVVLAGLKSRKLEEKPSDILKHAIEPTLEGARNSIEGWLAPIGNPFERDIHDYFKLFELQRSDQMPKDWVVLNGHYDTPYKYFDIIVGFEGIELSDAATGQHLELPGVPPQPAAIPAEAVAPKPTMPPQALPKSQTQTTVPKYERSKFNHHKNIPPHLAVPLLNYFEGAANLDWEQHAKSQLGEYAPQQSVQKVGKMFATLHSNKVKTVMSPLNIEQWWIDQNKAFVKCNQITSDGIKTWRIDLRNKPDGWAISTMFLSKL